MPGDPSTLALIALLVASFALRVYGFNWDEGQLIHPDEQHVRDIAVDRVRLPWPPDLDNLRDPGVSTLNTRPDAPDPERDRALSFAYGSLPLFVTDLVAESLNRLNRGLGTGWLAPGAAATDWHGPDHVYKVGRSLSMLLDTATVLLVYLIGRRLGNRRLALFAAAVAAFAPISIQLAHFFTTDSWLTFFVALCLLGCVEAARTGGIRWFAAAGAAVGLAMATKGSVFTLAGLVAVAIGYDVWRRWRSGERGWLAAAAAPERIAVAGVAALLCFAVFEPYGLLRPTAYRASLEEQANIQRGVIDVPYTRQYLGTIPVVYHANQLVRYGFGPVGGILALAGLPLLAWRIARRRGAAEVLALAWVLGYGLVIALPETKFLRYLAPLTPVLALSAGLAFDAAWRLVSRRLGGMAAAGLATVAMVGLITWAAAFASIYGREHTRLAASRWIYAHVPAGSVLSTEIWDRGLPLDLRAADGSVVPGLTVADQQYAFAAFDSYDDRPSWRDVTLLGDALDGHPITQAAADALATGDYPAAAAALRPLAAAAEAVEETERSALSRDLSLAARAMSGGSGALRSAAAVAAAGLRSADEAEEDPWAALGDALLETGDAEVGNALYRQLEQIDYYVVSSSRITSALPRSPWRYPVQTEFFRLLEDGTLGFRLVAEFTSRPGLGPWEVNDDAADEAWINYDHPRVLIFEKTGLVEKPLWDDLLAGARAQPVSPTRYGAEPANDLLLDEPVGDLPVVGDARWSAALTANSAAAFAVWLLLLGVLQVAGWPLASLVFGRFADAGWGFARLLALLVAGWIVWFGASWEVFAFRAVWCALAVAVVAALGWAARVRWRTGRRLWVSKPGQRRAALAGEVVFWAVFALFFVFRWVNPDSWHPYWGGERPMEFAHLNATLRSAHFPPYDPWFAGGYINYYYFGLYLVAFCLKLTGIPSEIAFNLAQPTVLALLASGGYSVAATLGRDAARRRALAIPAGVVGVVLLVGIGNLSAFFRFLRQPAGGVDDPFGYWTWGPTRAITHTINEFPFFTGLYGDLHAHAVALPVTVLAIGAAYALAREPRRLPLALAANHHDAPSRVVTGARLGSLALAIGTLGPTNAWDVAAYLGIGGVALLMATGAVRPWPARAALTVLLLGAVGGVAYGLFFPFFRRYVALFSSVGRVAEPTPFGQFAGHLGGLLTVTGIGLVVLLLGSARGRWRAWSQPLAPTLVVVGLLAGVSLTAERRAGALATLTDLLVVAVGLVLVGAAWVGIGNRARRSEQSTLGRGGLAIVALVVLRSVLTGQLVFGLLLAFAAAGAAVFLFGRGSAARYCGLLIGTAAAIAAGVEVIYLVDNLDGGADYRMNTVFKFYNQVWVLLALGGGALVARMLRDADHGRPRRPVAASPGMGIVHRSASVPTGRPSDSLPYAPVRQAGDRASRGHQASPPAQGWSRLGLAATAMVVAVSVFYPLLATGPRLAQRFDGHPGPGTLNGLDWMAYGTVTTNADGRPLRPPIAFADDRAAIDWFNAEVDGTPVIAEASIGTYRGNGSRFSIATGLPTIIGWEYHESQQRYAEQLDGRVADVERLYDTTDADEKLDILRAYGVAYVVVGALERSWTVERRPWASAEGIAAFEQMVGTSLEVAFRSGDTVVYRVLPAPAQP